MPVILPRDLETDWLDQGVSKEHAIALLEPYPASAMLALQVSTRVNSVRNDDPGLLVPDVLAA
jgi:putative SOS response-associated peptidase YedK